MEKRLLNNIGIKILSICLAAFFWVVIVNINDPVKSRTFTNVPVTVLNDDSLEAKNLAYEIVSGNTVDFTVSGKRTVIEKMKRTDFLVTADLAQLTEPFDTVKINVECTKYPDVTISMGKVNTMTISSEGKITKSFSVKVTTSGAAAPGYAEDTPEVSPVIIDVTGASSVINQIADVKARIDISGAESDVTDVVVPRAYDEDGKEIDRSKLEFSYESVTVTVPMLQTKNIPLVLNIQGEAASGYMYTDSNYQPQTIEVKGRKKALEQVESIPVSVDISGLSDDKDYTVPISDILQEYNVTPVDSDITSVVVSVSVEKTVEKVITFQYDDIIFKNIPEGYDVSESDSSGSYTVKITGLKDVLSGVTAETLAPTVDLSGIGKGSKTVTCEFTLPDEVDIITKPKVKIKIAKTETPETSIPPTESPSPSEKTSQTPEESVSPSAPVESDTPDTGEIDNSDDAVSSDKIADD